MLYCHWKCAAGAHCRLTNTALDEHAMSEFAMACPQSHDDHLVFSRKEVECILSIVVKMLLKPSCILPLFHCGLCFLKRDFM